MGRPRGQDKLPLALVWTAQSQGATAEEELPGQAAAAGGPAEDGSSGQALSSREGQVRLLQLRETEPLPGRSLSGLAGLWLPQAQSLEKAGLGTASPPEQLCAAVRVVPARDAARSRTRGCLAFYSEWKWELKGSRAETPQAFS